MVTVQSWEDLLHYGVECVFNKIRPEDVKLSENLVFTVKISGNSWDGFIDYRGANYILELQRTVNRIYQELSDADAPVKNLNKTITVKVRVVDGSSVFEINFGKAVMEMVQNLSGEQIVIIVGMVVFCAGGYWTIKEILKFKRDIAHNKTVIGLAEQQGKTVKQITELITPLVDRAINVVEKTDAERPSRALVSRLKQDDTITFHDDVLLTANNAKQRYPRKPPTKAESGLFDDIYKINSIDFDTTPPIFTISSDGFQFRAFAELAVKDIDLLATDLKKALETGDDFNTPLQIFIVFTKTGIKTASITGIGEKREHVKSVKELIHNFK